MKKGKTKRPAKKAVRSLKKPPKKSAPKPKVASGRARRAPEAPPVALNAWPGVIQKYREFLSVSEATPVVTLQEGNTPLIPAVALSAKLGRGIQVFYKYEGLNPTGSFKDRGMTMAVSKAKEAGARAVICASTGNTSASAAAYAGRAGMRCVVLIPEGKIALGKLAQALIHGAQVLAVKGSFDEALALVRQVTQETSFVLVNSINPHRLEGQKTAAYEICDALGQAPDYHAIPVGNAGNITAYWRGYKDYFNRNKIHALPRMIGFQAAGAAPLVLGRAVAKPDTIATAIQIGNPASWEGAMAAKNESKGLIRTVTDREILEAYQFLAEREGLFVEPASAASVAGVIKQGKKGYFQRGSTLVCVLTGHGLKDPERTVKTVASPKVIAPKLGVVMEQIR